MQIKMELLAYEINEFCPVFFNKQLPVGSSTLSLLF